MKDLVKAGWIEIPLGEIAELRGRIGWKGLTAKEYTKSGPRFLSVHSLNYGDYVDFRDAFHISQERYDESPEIMLQRDDILICKDGAGIGKLGVVPEILEPTTINSSLLLIRPGPKAVPKYLYFCLLSPYFQEIVQSRLEGATTPHLYQRDITTFPIFLPPLKEQQRIVAVLDEAFEGLARARAHAEANLQNARELFESYLEGVFVEGAWPEKTLDQISENLDRVRVPITKSKRVAGDIPYYGASGVVDHVADYLFDEDLLLISEDGANLLARTYPIAFPISGKSWVNNHAHVLRFNDPDAQEFVRLYLNSISLEPYVSGMAQPKLNQKQLNRIPIPFPDDDTRREIVSRAHTISKEKRRLERNYEAVLQDLDDLRQSLLQKAFAGELT
ncbi:MAG: restriction endonuclease subunit S [Alphaproteobacteria bacterium]